MIAMKPPERISCIALRRKRATHTESMENDENSILLFQAGRLLARISVWRIEDPRGRDTNSRRVSLHTQTDKNHITVEREEKIQEAQFDEAPPLVLNNSPCPKCNGTGNTISAPLPFGVVQGCDFCNRSGEVLAVFYPNAKP
jgi:hypothetical protein